MQPLGGQDPRALWCHNTTVGLIVMCVVKRAAAGCDNLAALLMLSRYTADLAVTPASVGAL